MEPRAQALLIKAGAFVFGALLNYLYLRVIGSTGFDNLVFLAFFAALFALSAMEFVSHFNPFGLRLTRFDWFFIEQKSRAATLASPQTICLPLCFCAVILGFQYLPK
jgi:hypothetical protein